MGLRKHGRYGFSGEGRFENGKMEGIKNFPFRIPINIIRHLRNAS